jgi:hypothetical protein
VNISIFPACTVAQVDAELEHIKTIGYNIFAEFGIDLPLLFGLCRKVKKYKDPHDSIGVKSFKHILLVKTVFAFLIGR